MKVKAISIRQPWAWLITNGFKTVENRTRRWHYTGRLFIHASGTFTHADRHACEIFCGGIGFDWRQIPDILPTGGIVGSVDLINCVEGVWPGDDWSTGPYSLVLQSPSQLIPFYRCKGRLGIFTINVPAKVAA